MLFIRKIRVALENAAPGAMAAFAAPVPSGAVVEVPPAAAAVGIPAPVPAALPPSGPKPDFKAVDISQYKSLRAAITDLEGQQVEAGAAAAQHRLQQANAQHAAATERARAAGAAQTQAQQRWEDVGSRCSCLPGGAKREAKQRAELETELDRAKGALAAAQQQIAQAEAQINTARGECDVLMPKVQELSQARSTLTALVERIYSDPVWASDPMMFSLRSAIQDLDRQAAQASGHAGTYGKGKELLTMANRKLSESLGGLQRSQVVAVLGVGRAMGPGRRRPPGSMMLNMAQMMAIRQANEMVKSAAQDVTNARQLLPAIPYNDEAVLGSARAGVFVSVLAPGVMGNMAASMMIRRSMETVQEMQRGVQQSLEWVNRNMDAFGLQVNTLQANGTAKRAEIVAFQLSQLEAAAVSAPNK